MQSGRKPKPTAVKALEGNPGKRSLNTGEPKPEKKAPRCPAWLEGEAKKEWKRMAGQMEKLGILTEIDMAAFAGYCQAYARWKEAEEFITQHGTIVKTPSGYWQQVPQVSIAQTYLKIMNRFCEQFGLTPSSRSRIVADNGEDSNHGDVEHLWSKFDLSMEQFRKDIKATMEGSTAEDSLTAIMGKAAATAEQMKSYLKKKNPSVAQSVLDMIPLYLSEGEAEGVRGDIAFAQSCLETGNFTFSGSAVTLSQNNFCGLGVTQRGKAGLSFDTPQLGIRAQVQHLKAYASTDKLLNERIDPRFRYAARGCAPYVEWLGQKENPQGKGWAAGEKYGEKILSILKAVMEEGKVQFMESLTISAPYMVRVAIPDLNIRRGPGMSYPKTGKFTGVGIFTIVEEKDGWGLLKAYEEERDGWISLALTTRI